MLLAFLVIVTDCKLVNLLLCIVVCDLLEVLLRCLWGDGRYFVGFDDLLGFSRCHRTQ